MTQYINKLEVVAEIEKLLNKDKYSTEYVNGKKYALKCILSFIDTLEVKEVDLKNEITQFLDTYFPDAKLGYKLGLRRTAKYFFELGIKTKGE